MGRARGMSTFAAAVLAAGLIVGGGAVGPAVAAPAPIGAFPVWTKTSATTFSGQLPAAAGGGVIGVVTDASSPTVAETGTAAFLGAQTGFGKRFGTSRYQSYLSIGLAPLLAPSTTTITIPASMPAGWGLAVGDIDADTVTITATGSGGVPLTPAQLGAQDTGLPGTPAPDLLNYCQGASPKPSGCGPGTTFTDAPIWCPDATFGGCAGLPAYPTVVGSGTDTAGAYDWFVPTVPVEQVTLTFRLQLGIPSYQLWIVAPASASTVSGVVQLTPGVPAPAGTVLALEQAGAPVLDIEQQPVVIPLASDGSFAFDTADGAYELDVVLPPGTPAPSGLAPLAFIAGGGAAALGTVAFAPVPAVPVPAAGPGAAELPATGSAPGLPLLLGLGLVALGTALALVRHRRIRGRVEGQIGVDDRLH